MNLQHRTIERYRLFFPNQTLRQVSVHTGIQITRVFRLLNGRTMKVNELEAFEKAIQLKIAENPDFARLNSSIEEASSLLTNEELGRVADYIERKIANKRYQRTYIRPLFDDVSIA